MIERRAVSDPQTTSADHETDPAVLWEALNAHAEEIARLRPALSRLSRAASDLLNSGHVKDRGDLVGALAQAGRALEGEDG